MKRYVGLVGLLSAFFLVSCSNESAIPLDEVVLSDYDIYHSFEDYTLWKKSEITEQAYYSYGISIGTEGDLCMAGHYHEVNFLVEFNNSFYSVSEAQKLGIYDCSSLRDIGFLIDQ